MALVKINEAALYAAGFDRVFVEIMRHLVRQVGNEVGGVTLPQAAGTADTLSPIVNGLTITITATNQTVSDLQTDAPNLPRSDAHLVRRLDDMDMSAERVALSLSGIIRRLDDLDVSAAQAVTISELTRRISELENRTTS